MTPNVPTDQEYLLYLRLKASLQDSFNAFVEYQKVALPAWQKLNKPFVGAKGFPGWQEYMETVAHPLNTETYKIVWDLAWLLHPDVPDFLIPFMNYYTMFRERYSQWKDGTFPEWEFVSGYWKPDDKGRPVFFGVNFPSDLEFHVDKRLAELVDDIQYTKPKQELQEKPFMARIIAIPALIAGIGIGLAAAILADRYLPEAEPLDEEGSATEFASDVSDEFEEDNVTAADINDAADGGSTLLDGLEGITVPGTNADLLNVRILGVERAKLVAMWGTKGVGGDQPTEFRRLADLTTEHLINIRDKSHVVKPDELVVIHSILEDRVAAGQADESVLDD